MNFRTKRVLAKLTKSYCAYKMGLSLADYDAVEKGFKGIDSSKVELFSEMTSKKTQKKYQLEQTQLMHDAQEWYKNVNLDDEIKSFGYSRGALAKAMNISTTKIWDYANHNEDRIGSTGILEFYLFFQDENNRVYNKTKVATKEKKQEKDNNADDILNAISQLVIKDNNQEKKDILLNENTETISNMIEDISIEDTSLENGYQDLETKNQDLTERNDRGYYNQKSPNNMESSVLEDIKNLQKRMESIEHKYDDKERELKILTIRCKAYESYLLDLECQRGDNNYV